MRRLRHFLGRAQRRLRGRAVAALLGEAVLRDAGNFRMWEAQGYHLLPVHFYSPVPKLAALEADYPGDSALAGIDMNEAGQLQLLQDRLAPFAAAFQGLRAQPPAPFQLQSSAFGGIDPYAYYSLIRAFQPQRIIEVGAGYSTHVAALAVQQNGSGSITCIEPYPGEALQRLEGRVKVLPQGAEATPPDFFQQLGANDILFIDSTHTLRMGGDVSHLFLEVLPRLAPGVLVHVHDIFLPQPYPRAFVLERRLFWMEQALLQAYLVGNTRVEVLLACNYLALRQGAALRAAFADAPYYEGSGSFWFRVR